MKLLGILGNRSQFEDASRCIDPVASEAATLQAGLRLS